MIHDLNNKQKTFIKQNNENNKETIIWEKAATPMIANLSMIFFFL